MPYSAAQIANEFITLASREAIELDPLKIQKLIYLTHGWSLAFLDRPLIEEAIEAWTYGPVVPEIYRAFRSYGYSSIDKTLPIPDNTTEIDEQSRRLIAEVWKTYKGRTGVQLSMLTHEPGYAWDVTRREQGDSRRFNSPTISNEMIKSEFDRRKKKG